MEAIGVEYVEQCPEKLIVLASLLGKRQSDIAPPAPGGCMAAEGNPKRPLPRHLLDLGHKDDGPHRPDTQRDAQGREVLHAPANGISPLPGGTLSSSALLGCC